MTAYEILIVGEAPSGRMSGGSRKRIEELAGAPVERWAVWVNLLDEWPGSGTGKGSAWNAGAAKRGAAKLDFTAYALVVLLGRRVAGTVLPGGAGLPWFRRVPHGGATFICVPHPSGIVRWWNEEENVERARAFFSGLSETALAREGEHEVHSNQRYPATTTPKRTENPDMATATATKIDSGLRDAVAKKITEAVKGKVEKTEKKGYLRLNLNGKTLAYVSNATRSGVRVEIPAAEKGYNVFKVEKLGDAAKTVTDAKRRATAIDKPAPKTAKAAAAPAGAKAGDADGPAVTPNTVVLNPGKAKPDPKPNGGRSTKRSAPAA